MLSNSAPKPKVAFAFAVVTFRLTRGAAQKTFFQKKKSERYVVFLVNYFKNIFSLPPTMDASVEPPPGKIHEYLEKRYWEKRFEKEENFEWVCSYKEVQSYLLRDLKVNDRILVVGCGNSNLSAEIFDAGFQTVASVDFSTGVIDKMRKRYKDSHPNLQWSVADVCNLKNFKDGRFDVVIEKCLLDTLTTNEGSVWNPNDQTKSRMKEALTSIDRVLTNQGTLISIHFQQPHFRNEYLKCDSFRWSDRISTFPIDYGLGYFYTMCSNK